jgi:hypothetical protein
MMMMYLISKAYHFFQVCPLNSFDGDNYWIAIEDLRLAPPGTHLSKSTYETLELSQTVLDLLLEGMIKQKNPSRKSVEITERMNSIKSTKNSFPLSNSNILPPLHPPPPPSLSNHIQSKKNYDIESKNVHKQLGLLPEKKNGVGVKESSTKLEENKSSSMPVSGTLISAPAEIMPFTLDKIEDVTEVNDASIFGQKMYYRLHRRFDSKIDSRKESFINNQQDENISNEKSSDLNASMNRSLANQVIRLPLRNNLMSSTEENNLSTDSPSDKTQDFSTTMSLDSSNVLFSFNTQSDMVSDNHCYIHPDSIQKNLSMPRSKDPRHQIVGLQSRQNNFVPTVLASNSKINESEEIRKLE